MKSKVNHFNWHVMVCVELANFLLKFLSLKFLVTAPLAVFFSKVGNDTVVNGHFESKSLLTIKLTSLRLFEND